MDDKKRQAGGAYRVALVGVLAALSLVFLLLSAFVPSGRLGLVAVAGVIPAGAVVSAGLASGFLCYGVTGLLGLLLLPVKSNALLYLLFFGLYPMIKSLIEGVRRLPLELLLKLAFFNLILTVFWFGLSGVFLPFLPAVLRGSAWAVYAAGNVVFLIYDFGFSKLIAFYIQRIDRVLRKRA